jgi:hypothetical protein
MMCMHPTATKAKQQEWYATRVAKRAVLSDTVDNALDRGGGHREDGTTDRWVDEVRSVLAGGELFEPTAGRQGHV